MFYWQNSCDKRQIYFFNELCKQKRFGSPNETVQRISKKKLRN